MRIRYVLVNTKQMTLFISTHASEKYILQFILKQIFNYKWFLCTTSQMKVTSVFNSLINCFTIQVKLDLDVVAKTMTVSQNNLVKNCQLSH